jgi:hypothetical protein
MAPPTVTMDANGNLTANWVAPRSIGSGGPIQGYDVTVFDKASGGGIYDIVTDGSTFTATIPHEYLQNFGAVHNIAAPGGPAVLRGSYALQVAAYKSDMLIWSPQSGNSRTVTETQRLSIQPVKVTIPNSKATSHAVMVPITIVNTGNVTETVDLAGVGAFVSPGVTATLVNASPVTLLPGQSGVGVWTVQVTAANVSPGRYVAYLSVVDAGPALPEPPGTQPYTTDLAAPGTVLSTPAVIAQVAR